MRPLLIASGLALWAGATVLLSRVRWVARPSLTERLGPFVPSGAGGAPRPGALSVASLRETLAPLARTGGERLAAALGVREDVGVRLQRIHSPLDATGFRLRQVGAATAAFAVAALLVAALPALRGPVGLLPLFGGPLLAFLVLEHQLARASARWQRRLFLELPVVAEQLAMLLASGYSLGGALVRLAERGHGAAATDLRRVVARVRQGLTEPQALREWAAVAQVDALDRLVPVAAMSRETADLGRLLAEEARAVRKEVQRDVAERAERKGQQVWIPVTVATLVPGVVFILIPFLSAMRSFLE